MAHDDDEGGFFNEISKYQELEQVEGLTLYDIERKPFPKVPSTIEHFNGLAATPPVPRKLVLGQSHSPPAA